MHIVRLGGTTRVSTSLVLGPGTAPKSAMGSAVVGVHRHHESAIPTLLAPCGGRVIHRTFRKRSLCVNGSPALFRLERPWGEKCGKHAILRCPRIGARIRQKSIDKRLQMALLSAPGGPKPGMYTPKTYNVVGDILDRLFLATLTSAVYANSSSQQL